MRSGAFPNDSTWPRLARNSSMIFSFQSLATARSSWTDNGGLHPTRAASAREVPQPPIEVRTFRIGFDPVRVEEEAFPSRSVVPLGAPRRHREVGPAVGDAEPPKIDVPDACAIGIEHRVGCARVPVTHH